MSKKKPITESDRRFLDQISIFEKEQKKLSKLVGHKAGEHYESTQAMVSILRATLEMYIGVIPKAEKVFNKYRSERSAYALVSLTNTMRDVLKDLMSLSQASQLDQKVMKTVVDPAILTLAQTHISGLKEIKRKVYSTCKDSKESRKLKNTIQKVIDGESEHITEIRNQVTEQISKTLAI